MITRSKGWFYFKQQGYEFRFDGDTLWVHFGEIWVQMFSDD